ncbi:MAG: hypothetical protein R3244_11670, partial [Thermoanaerobaculia bacterium]|nr:hypothetical protein [Thermoanaerobaculia bacterium]
GDHERELKAARSAVSRYPTVDHFWFRLSELEALLQLGRVEEASRRITDVGSTTDLHWATLALEEAHLLGAREEARRMAPLLVQRASELAAAEPGEATWIRHLRARLLLVAGQPKEARQLFSKLVEMATTGKPRRWRLSNLEAIAAAEAGDPDPARAALSGDLGDDAAIQYGEAEVWRAALLARLGRKKAALDAIEVLLAGHPTWRSRLSAFERWSSRWNSVPATLYVPLIDEPRFRRLLTASPHPTSSATARADRQ